MRNGAPQRREVYGSRRGSHACGGARIYRPPPKQNRRRRVSVGRTGSRFRARTHPAPHGCGFGTGRTRTTALRFFEHGPRRGLARISGAGASAMRRADLRPPAPGTRGAPARTARGYGRYFRTHAIHATGGYLGNQRGYPRPRTPADDSAIGTRCRNDKDRSDSGTFRSAAPRTFESSAALRRLIVFWGLPISSPCPAARNDWEICSKAANIRR